MGTAPSCDPSQRPPYGNPLPGAGAVHHIKSNPAISPDPQIPKDLRNRQADNWRPLIAIADCFGANWAAAARDAAIAIHRDYRDEDMGVVLLSDIRGVFNDRSAEAISSEALVGALV